MEPELVADAAAAAAVSNGAVFAPWLARRSVRRYAPQPIAQPIVRALLEAATAAPSAHNRQPWRFAVVSGAGSKTRLAHAMGQRLRQDRLADCDACDDVEADVARSFARITGAATVVLVCLSMEHMDVYPEGRRNRHEHQMAVQSTAMAGQNLLLAAQAQGLGACWLCAPLFCADVVRDALALPTHWEAQGMITLGYPAAAGKPYVRRPLSEVALFLNDDA
jgi:F420 biosynthesis protein FbiB-like protein